VSGYEIVAVNFTVPALGVTTGEAVCPSGKKVLGGGFNVNVELDVFQSLPDISGGGKWTEPGVLEFLELGPRPVPDRLADAASAPNAGGEGAPA
jgi:hypothetical protein